MWLNGLGSPFEGRNYFIDRIPLLIAPLLKHGTILSKIQLSAQSKENSFGL